MYKYIFSRDNVGYYHHLAYIIDRQNKLLGKSFGGPNKTIVLDPHDKRLVKYTLHKYGLIGSLMSATVIRREVINNKYLSQLKKLVTGQDTFLFLASLSSNYLLIHEPLNLSFYRIHGQQASLPRGSSPKETLKRFARQAVLNQHGYYQLSSNFLFIKDLPFRHNLLGAYHYNVLGLIVLGLDRRLVLSTGFIALWRGLFDKSIYRILTGILGIVYCIIPRKAVQQLLLKYYIKRLMYEK